MLYHYASTDSLRRLHAAVTGMIDGVVNPLLELAKRQNRDAVMTSDRWGERDTSGTWANNAWPFLKDLQRSLAKDIALRAFDQYKLTATNENLRAAEQYSMLWASDEEEERYQAAVKLINHLAHPIDSTLYDREESRWSDFAFMSDYPSYHLEQPLRPTFRIRTDISGRTGEVAPRTGVYISADDQHAALQFAWEGKTGCKLRLATTFNDLGLAALHYVGRPGLWTDTLKMFEFASQPQYWGIFRDKLSINGKIYGDLAPSVVAQSAFEAKPSIWHFVEQVDGEDVDSGLVWEDAFDHTGPTRLAAGDQCKVSGFYYSAANPDSRRYFQAGETMPSLETDYGDTYWQWDNRQ